MHFAITALAALSFALAAPAQQEPGRREIATTEPRPLVGRAPSVPEDWREDPSKHRRAWESQVGGTEYLEALRATGMAAHLTRVQRTGGAPDGPSTWTPTGPVGGHGKGDNGRISGIQLVSSGATNWIYAGACGGGLWRSDLATAAVWESLGDGLPNPSVRAFAVHPDDNQRILVGTGDVKRYRGGGLYKTDDGGASWHLVPLSPTPGHFYRVLHSLDESNVVLAASDNGLWRSTTAGDTWTAVRTGHWSDLVLHPTLPGTMFAVQQGTGVFKSTNKGLTWTPLTSPNLPATASWGRSCLAVCRDYPNNVALAVEHQGLIHGVYRSPDGGATWSDITSDLGTFGGSQATHALALTFRTNDPNELFLGTDTIARSWWDSGAAKIRWKVGEVAAGLQIGHADITQLVFSPVTGDDVLWMPNDGGLWYHIFTLTWTGNANGNSSTGLNVMQIDHLDANRSMGLIGLQDNGVLRTVNAGASWDQIGGGDGGGLRIVDPEAGDSWFWKGVGWTAWRALYGQSTEAVPNPGLVQSFHYDPIGGRVWAGGGTVVRSAGAYASPIVWTPEIQGGTHTAPGHQIRRIWGSVLETGTIFLSYKFAYDGDLTVVSKPGGNWDFNQTTLAPNGWIESVTPSSEWPGECWVGVTAAAGQPKIYHTTDYGDTWEDLSGTLASVGTVYAVVPQPFKPSALFAATDIGVFRSTDAGQTWQPFQDGLPVVGVRGLAFVVSDAHTGVHKLRAATYGRGTWERDVVAPPVVYVDRDYTGTEDGTFEHPWNTIAKAVNAAPTGAIVAVRGKTYFEPQLITRGLTLMTYKAHTVIR